MRSGTVVVRLAGLVLASACLAQPVLAQDFAVNATTLNMTALEELLTMEDAWQMADPDPGILWKFGQDHSFTFYRERTRTSSYVPTIWYGLWRVIEWGGRPILELTGCVEDPPILNIRAANETIGVYDMSGSESGSLRLTDIWALYNADACDYCLNRSGWENGDAQELFRTAEPYAACKLECDTLDQERGNTACAQCALDNGVPDTAVSIPSGSRIVWGWPESCTDDSVRTCLVVAGSMLVGGYREGFPADCVSACAVGFTRHTLEVDLFQLDSGAPGRYVPATFNMVTLMRQETDLEAARLINPSCSIANAAAEPGMDDQQTAPGDAAPPEEGEGTGDGQQEDANLP